MLVYILLFLLIVYVFTEHYLAIFKKALIACSFWKIWYIKNES